MTTTTCKTEEASPGRARIEQYIPLVYHIYGKVAKICPEEFGRNKDEYIGEGYLALCRADQHFNKKRGVLFKTYAYQIIRTAMVAWHFQKRPVVTITRTGHLTNPEQCEAAFRTKNLSDERCYLDKVDEKIDYESLVAKFKSVLKPEYKKLFDEHYILGYSITELAQKYDCSKQNIDNKMRVIRYALGKLYYRNMRRREGNS